MKENLKPHNKYFYAMTKYQDYAIITVDDDIIYSKTMAETLLKGYWKHPNCVIARRVHKKRKDSKGNLLPYKKWVFECKTVTEPSMELFATGVGGVLYPPNILNLSEKDLPLIREILNADDVFLNHIEVGKRIKVFYVKDAKDKPIKDDVTQKRALYKTNCTGGNDAYLKKLAAAKKKAVKPATSKVKKPVVKNVAKKPAVVKAVKKAVSTKYKRERPESKTWNEFFY